MHILLITQEDFLAGSTFSVSFLAKGLASRGHRVFVAARKDSLLQSLVENTEVTFLPVTFKRRFSLREARRIRDWVRTFGIQIINPQSSKDRYASILAKHWYRLPVKVILTRRQYPLGELGFFKRIFYSKGADKIVVISYGLRDIFLQKGYKKKDLHVIHNGIPEERYKEWSQDSVDSLKVKFGIERSDIVIGCISRFKKHDQLIRAVAQINNPKIKLVFAGFDPKRLEPILQEVRIPNPIFCEGFIKKEDVLNYYRVLTVNVLPSTSEGFGLVLLESMAMGCPVVATNFGGIRDVVKDEVNGLLFDDGNIDMLARQIQRIIDDADLRDRLIKDGYRTVHEEFTMQKTIAHWEHFFAGMIP